LNYKDFFAAVKENFCSAPPAATVFVTDPRFPVKHLSQFYFAGHSIRRRRFSQALQEHTHKEKAKPSGLTPPGPFLVAQASRLCSGPNG
jgi:hypothetical protein